MISKPKVITTVEARMSSTRLPGKVLLPLLGQEMLWHIIQRLERSQFISKVIIATTVSSQDDAIVNFCKRNDVAYHRGSVDNVLERIIEAASPWHPDLIVQATGDNPCIDPHLVDEVINAWLHTNVDYVGNHFHNVPCGLDVRAFTFEAIKQVREKTHDPIDLIHGSYYLYTHPDEFHIESVKSTFPNELSDVRLTVDEPKDYQLMQHIFEHLGGNDWDANQLAELFHKHPHLLDVNADVRQKDPVEA